MFLLALIVAAAPPALIEEDRSMVSAGRAALYVVTNDGGWPAGMFDGEKLPADDPALKVFTEADKVCQLMGEPMLTAVRVDVDGDGTEEVVADLGCVPTGGSTAIVTQEKGKPPRVAMSFFDERILAVNAKKGAIEFVTYEAGYGSARDRYVRVTRCRSLGVSCRSLRLRFRGDVAGGAATRAIVPMTLVSDARLRQDITIDDAPEDPGSDSPLPGNVTRTFAKGSTGLVLSEIRDVDAGKRMSWLLVALPDPGSSDDRDVMLRPVKVTRPKRLLEQTLVVGFVPATSVRDLR